MSLTNKLLTPILRKSFTPADPVNWARIETLVHGPGASDASNLLKGGDGNSAVFACLMAVALAAIEAPKRVYRRGDDDQDELWMESPLQALLDKPTLNDELTPEELDFWVSWALHTDGNAYLMKTRSGNERTGNVIEYWPVSPSIMHPYTRRGSNDYITSYKLEYSPGQFDDIPVENVIHFRLGIDARDHRVGMSPIKRLVREISTDVEASKFTDALLQNFAVPGLVVVPGAGSGLITPEKAREMEDKMARKFSNDNRGKIAILSQDATIQQFGFSPKDLDLHALHRIPEERIAAVIGIPAIVANLGAGLDRATYSNFAEAREMFTESRLVPYWHLVAQKMTRSLVPDFHSEPGVSIQYDITNVRSLQEDEDRKYARLDMGVRGGWIARAEARADIGLPPDMPEELAPELPDDLPQDQPEEGVEGEMMRPFGYKATREVPDEPLNPNERTMRRLERAGIREIGAALEAYRDRILAGANEASVSMLPQRASSPDVVKPLSNTIVLWLDGVVSAGVEQGRETIEREIFGTKQVVMIDWALPNIEASVWATAHAGRLVRGITQTTIDSLRRDVDWFVMTGVELSDLIERIQSSYSFSPSRAEAIAVTEVTAAYYEGSKAAWRNSGVIDGKEWQTAADEIVKDCPICAPMQGRVAPLDEPWEHPNLGAVDLPGHVRCRCWATPVVMR